MAVVTGLIVLVVGSIIVASYWSEIVEWYRFRQLFEGLS